MSLKDHACTCEPSLPPVDAIYIQCIVYCKVNCTFWQNWELPMTGFLLWSASARLSHILHTIWQLLNYRQANQTFCFGDYRSYKLLVCVCVCVFHNKWSQPIESWSSINSWINYRPQGVKCHVVLNNRKLKLYSKILLLKARKINLSTII